MKKLVGSAFTILSLCVSSGQGFIYDQQSSVEGAYGEGLSYIQQNQPIGQSFIPSLPGVGFVRLYVNNGHFGDTSAATLYVNLLSNSITGGVIAQSAPVAIPGGALFAGPVDFFFSTMVPVAPGTTYFFQPVVQNNNNLGVNVSQYNYAGGTAWIGGVTSPANDLWFREGILIPEPCSGCLILLCVALWKVRSRTCGHTADG